MTTLLDEIRENFVRNFGGTSAEAQIPSLVEFERRGIEASERVGDGWCACADTTDQETYYRKPIKGTHGWFHDPVLGGCGGVTQTG
jgi:hypothetical protein